MQSNVNVDELNGVALEIAKSIQQLNQSISDFKETSNSIKGQCETLNGYNGQKVAGTTTKEQVYDDKGYSSTIETYKIKNYFCKVCKIIWQTISIVTTFNNIFRTLFIFNSDFVVLCFIWIFHHIYRITLYM